MAYVAVTVEGGLFPSDMLDRIATGQAHGWRPQDFGLSPSRRLSDEIQGTFSDARSFWDAFQRRLAHSSERSTTLTREAWIIPLLELLGFDLLFQRSAAQIGSDSYFISHRASDDPDAPPVHIVAIEQPLDRKAEGFRRSPHALIQEYLNRSDALWGMVTNGERIRLLRNSARLARPTYLEFDLRAMVEGNLYSEFVVLYRLLHRSRFPCGAADAHECLLERYYQQGLDEGSRVREKLRDGVEDALRVLGNAFLAHPESGSLRNKFEHGQMDAPRYYRQLLRLVYRFLFLMVAEERRLIFPSSGDGNADLQSIYTRYYSVSRLRDRCERYFAEDHYSDLWEGLLQTFRLFRDEDSARKLGLGALDGELFGSHACEDLEGAACTNEQLLMAVRHLSTFLDEKQRRRVNYAGLDVEELGSVYESLLDFQPQVTLEPPAFDLVTGGERKQTGSYYTPPELVRELIESALVPVIEDRLEKLKTREEKEKALLTLNVCDPASGSGHFLLAAARRIGRELARVRTSEEEPTPAAYREAVRDVIRNCIYAVDKNPLAVDLCKVALWIEGHSAGLPLSFLDHHVKCGDSLVGVAGLKVLTEGIPDGAYKPVTGDDKQAAAGYKKRNQEERTGQLTMGLADTAAESPETLADDFQAFAALEERNPDEVRAKEELYQSLRDRRSDWWKLKVACDLWTAAFFTVLAPTDSGQPDLVPTTNAVRNAIADRAVQQALEGAAIGLSQKQPFFHWPLEFPEVFAAGGFDVVLGNPPWERIKLQEKEFFAGRDPEIAAAPNKAARERLIKQLPERNPTLAAELAVAKHDAEAGSKFVRASRRFPLGAVGDVNTYALFAEHFLNSTGPWGRAGLIVPTGLATDYSLRRFFGHLVEGERLVSLFDFENVEGLFPEVHRGQKFCLLTLSGNRRRTRNSEFAFFLHRAEELRLHDRKSTLTPEDFALLNPNTGTCPIFRNRRDAEITKSVYQRLPVLRNAEIQDNPWNVEFLAMFHMSNDSHLFRTQDPLERDGWCLRGNHFIRGQETYLPLYEDWMMFLYNHRLQSNGEREATDEKLADPSWLPLPRYWVPKDEVWARRGSHQEEGWLLAFRNRTSTNTNARTVVCAAIPAVGAGNPVPVIELLSSSAGRGHLLLACLSSYVLDYLARQKVGGMNLNFFYLEQLTVLPPSTYEQPCSWTSTSTIEGWIVPRVLELVYTAWDMEPFARDIGYQGPPFRWDPERGFPLRCELDAAFFHLYGIEREDADYIMDTFPIVKRQEERHFAEYRTKRVILEIYDEMALATARDEPYRTRLDPPPADPRVAHLAAKEVP